MALSIAILFLLCLIITQVDKAFVSAEDKTASAEKQAADAEKEAAQAQETSVSSIHILAAGNNIYDENILAAGQAAGSTWNYDSVYSLVKDQINQADLSIITQESAFTSDHNLTSGSDVYSTLWRWAAHWQTQDSTSSPAPRTMRTTSARNICKTR